MQNRVTVRIAARDYTLLSEESEEYMQSLAELVSLKIHDFKRGSGLSDMDAANLAALSIADECRKAQTQAENARDQIQSCLDDARRARAEAAELKREMSRRRPDDNRQLEITE